MHTICCLNFDDISTPCLSVLALSGYANLWQLHMYFSWCGRNIARMLCFLIVCVFVLCPISQRINSSKTIACFILEFAASFDFSFCGDKEGS